MQEKKFFSRFVAIAVTLAMLVGMFPMMVMAEEASDHAHEGSENNQMYNGLEADYVHNVPDDDYAYDILDEDYTYDILDGDYTYNVPDDDYAYDILDDDYTYDVPEFDYTYDIPENDYAYDVSDDDYTYDVPEDDYTYDIPDDDYGALGDAVAGSGLILAFEPLESSVAAQFVTLGAEVSDLYLPTTLSATVMYTLDSTHANEALYDIRTVNIPIYWRSPDFDGAVQGEYTFYAVIPLGYSIETNPPNIVVVVEAVGIQATATFNPGEYSLRLQGLGTVASGFAPNQGGTRALVAGETLNFSVWVRGNASNLNIHFSGPTTLNLVNRAISYGDWTQITAQVPVAVAGWYSLLITGTTVGDDVLLIDNLSITGYTINNPNFEFGFDNWATFDWNGRPGTNGWSIHANNIFDPGENSLRLQGAGTVASGFAPNQGATRALVAGETLSFSAWVRGNASNLNIHFSGPTTLNLVNRGVSYGDWTQITAEVPVVVGGWYTLIISGTNSGSDVLLIDNISITDYTINNPDFAQGFDNWAAFDWNGRPGTNGWSIYSHSGDVSGSNGVAFSDFSGRLGEWGEVDHDSVTASSLTLRATTDGRLLYTIVEGSFRDTRNVYFISINGRSGGFTRHGRPNVHYIVANGYLFQATGNNSSATPEFVQNATRLGRIGMEYWRGWTGMQLRLDQIGNPNPSDIRISYRGFSAANNSTTVVNVPASTSGFLDLTTSFTRGTTLPAPSGSNVHVPVRDYSIIFNPMMGGGADLQHNGRPIDGQNFGYAYITWRGLEEVRGELNLDTLRVYTYGDYPVTGPNQNQWQANRGPLVTDVLRQYAERGVYVNLRFIMDYPAGVPWGYWGSGDQTGRNRTEDQIAQANLMARRVADIPDWLIEAMRAAPNRPNPNCSDNVNCTRVLPNGTQTVFCPNGCIPYGRPAGLRTTPDMGPGRNGEMGWHPNENWGPEGVWYNSRGQISGGVGLAPRYYHHLMLYYHERVINALAEEIARPGSPWNAIVNVQLGTLGHWGEWHNWPTENAGTFPNAQVAYEFVRHYIDAFADNPNVQIAMRYANWIGARYSLGYFHDEAFQASHFTMLNTLAQQNLAPANNSPTGWGAGHGEGTATNNNLNANMANVPAFTGLANAAAYAAAATHPEWWMHSWSGGEFGDTSAPVGWGVDMGNSPTNAMADISTGQSGGNHVMRSINAARWLHLSNLAPRGPMAGRTNATTPAMQAAHKNNDAVFDNMGYRFVIEEFYINSNLSTNSTARVSMVVNNQGVAPFYRQWPVEISFINSSGNVAATYRVPTSEVDIRTWMPRHRAINNARQIHPDGTLVRNANGSLPTPNRFIPAFDGRNIVEFNVPVPSNLPAGEYTIAIAILDTILGNYNPGIMFHNMGRRADGRLPLSTVTVGGGRMAALDSTNGELHIARQRDCGVLEH